MARFAVDFTDFSGRFAGTDDTGIESHLQDIRDRLRSEVSGSDFVVSDICKWDGNSFGNARGYAFIIKKGNREWLFVKGQSDSTSLDFADIVCNNDSTTMDNFWRFVDQHDTVSTNSDCSFGVHYNCNVGTYGMGFDDNVDLTYTGGDFSSPASNPFSDPYNFFPVTEPNVDDILYGLAYSSTSFSDDKHDFSRHLFVLDDTHDVLTWYATPESEPLIHTIALFGEALTNYDTGTDPNQETVSSIELSESSTTSPGSHNSENIRAFDDAGVPASFDIVAHENFTVDNRKDSNGDFYWNSVQVKSDTYMKGLFKSDLVRVSGTFESILDRFKILDGPTGPLFLASGKLAFPYAPNLERFPFPGDE